MNIPEGKWWTWNGRRLAHPLTIIRRLLAWPFFYTFRALTWLSVLIGWGFDEAGRVWSDLT